MKLGKFGAQFYKRHKTGQFHEKGKNYQKISELGKKSVFIVRSSGQFHSKRVNYATKLVLRLSKLHDWSEKKNIIEIV